MTDTRQWALILNDYTKEVLKEAVEVNLSLPKDCNLMIAASSDVVLQHLKSGRWVGIQMTGLDKQARRWAPWRGDWPIDPLDPSSYPTLQEAVDILIEGFRY